MPAKEEALFARRMHANRVRKCVCVRAQRYLRRKCRYSQVNDSIESKSHKSPDFIDIFNWRAPNQIDLPGSIKCSMTLK